MAGTGCWALWLLPRGPLARPFPEVVGLTLWTSPLPVAEVAGKMPVGSWDRVQGEQDLPRLAGRTQQRLRATPIQVHKKISIDVFYFAKTSGGLSITSAAVPAVCGCVGVRRAAVQRRLLYPVFVKGLSS